MWHQLFWSMPEHESTWNGIPLSVEQLRRDRLVLADVVHQNVFNELPRVLGDLDRLASELTRAWCRGEKFGGFDFGSTVVPGGDLWDELRILIARSIEPNHPLRRLLELGDAVGMYLLTLSSRGLESDRRSEAGVVADVLPLARSASEIPKDVLRHIPRLASFVDFFKLSRDQGRITSLADYLEQQPDGSKFYSAGSSLSVLVQRDFAFELDASIESGLGSLREMPGSPKPNWNLENDRTLRFRGAVVKRITRRGTDIERVLDAFQIQGWPDSILHPFLDDPNLTTTKPYELVDSLNEHLVEIRFHVEESGRRIAWGPASPR